MVVWRRRIDNDWLYRAQQIVEGFITKPEEYEEPTCGPGPFSMADADTTSEIFKFAGFENLALHRCDIPILIGNDIEQAIEMVTAIGPAGEILRLAGDRAAHLHDQIRAALRDGLAEYETPDGVYAPASTWIVAARNPQLAAEVDKDDHRAAGSGDLCADLEGLRAERYVAAADHQAAVAVAVVLRAAKVRARPETPSLVQPRPSGRAPDAVGADLKRDRPRRLG